MSRDIRVCAKVSTTARRVEVDAGGRLSPLLRIAVWTVCERMNHRLGRYLGISLLRKGMCIFGAGTGLVLCAQLIGLYESDPGKGRLGLVTANSSQTKTADALCRYISMCDRLRKLQIFCS